MQEVLYPHLHTRAHCVRRLQRGSHDGSDPSSVLRNAFHWKTIWTTANPLSNAFSEYETWKTLSIPAGVRSESNSSQKNWHEAESATYSERAIPKAPYACQDTHANARSWWERV